jgi:hypothetical protein
VPHWNKYNPHKPNCHENLVADNFITIFTTSECGDEDDESGADYIKPWDES